MDEICQSVETKFGVINGRDSFFLDFFDFDVEQNVLMLRGLLNLGGSFTSHIGASLGVRELFYSLSFRGVLAFSVLELDSWKKLNRERESLSSFDEILHSRWQAKMITSGKITPHHKHYVFATYDDVFDIICHDFQMNFRQNV